MIDVLKVKNNRVAIIVSISFHFFVLLLLLFIKLSLRPDVSGFTEITFIRGGDKASSTPAFQKGGSLATLENENQQPELSAMVNLPLRKMEEPDPTKLKVMDQAQPIPIEKVQPLLGSGAQDQKKENLEALLTNHSAIQKDIFIPSEGASTNEKPVPSPSTAPGFSHQTPYQIEGQAASRSVIYKVIPEYPDDLQKQAIIKIGFTVLPGGQIGEMILLIKSDTQLEKLTLDAFRQWRFNPLPAETPPRIERGIITFRYVLK